MARTIKAIKTMYNQTEHFAQFDYRGIANTPEYKLIPLGDFVNYQQSTSSTKLSTASQTVLSMESSIATPYDEATIFISVNPEYKVKIFSGTHHSKLTVASSWLLDGDTYKFPADHIYFRASVSSIDENVNINPDKLNIIDLELRYVDNYNIVAHNHDAIRYLDIFRGTYGSAGSNSAKDKYAVLTHSSDIHGDSIRLNRHLEFADVINAAFTCISGDICAYGVDNGYSAMINEMASHKTPVMLSTGNHDVYGVAKTASSDLSKYNTMFKKIDDAHEYVNEIINGQTSTWHYKDNEKYKIRIICLDCFERLGASSTTWNKHLNQAQVTFLINALSTMDEGWGALLVYHDPEVTINGATNKGDGTFFNSTWRYTAVNTKDYTGNMILDIIDAFIGRTSIDTKYTQASTYGVDGSTILPEITVQANFSSCPGHFIAHVTGHFHQEGICQIPNTKWPQIMLNVPCGTSNHGNAGGYAYLSDNLDTPRLKSSVSQDLFNCYVLDTDKKRIHVVRVGSDLTYEGKDRKHMTISYNPGDVPPATYGEGYLFNTAGKQKLNISLSAADWEQGSVTKDGPITSATSSTDTRYNYRIHTINAINVTDIKKLYIKVSPNYEVGLRVGTSTTNLPNNLYWFNNTGKSEGVPSSNAGYIATIPSGCTTAYLIIAGAAAEGTTNEISISPEDITSCGLELWY